MMECDIKIMAHLSRVNNVKALVKKIELNIQTDVFFDDRQGYHDAMYTARKTWALPIEKGITHRCVIQDDVDVCLDFRKSINQIVNCFPNVIFSLFYSRKLPTTKNFIKVNGCWIYGQAIIIPVQYITDIFELNDTFPLFPHDDALISYYASKKNIPVFTTYPHLVQHIAPTNSIIHKNNKLKVSKYFIGSDVSGQIINWSNRDYNSITCKTKLMERWIDEQSRL